MPAKPFSVRPSSLEFGDVQIGEIVTHRLIVTNETASSINFVLDMKSLNGNSDFQINEEYKNVLQPFETKKLAIRFKPITHGRQHHEMILNASGTHQGQLITISGNGTSAVRNSLRYVVLPPREIEKAGEHFVLPIADTTFLRKVEAVLGEPFEWYTVVSTGTKGGAIQSHADCEPGEVFLSPEVSTRKKPGAVFGFDVQQVYYKWKTDVKYTIIDNIFLGELNEAVGHSVDKCLRNTRKCRNQLTDDYRGLGRFVIEAPDEGDIFEITKDGVMGLFIVISPLHISARYTQCFHKKAALVVRAELSSNDDQTSSYAVLTEAIDGLGRLWVACYTVSMCSLENNPKTNYQVRPSDFQLSSKDLQAIRERVLSYMGIES